LQEADADPIGDGRFELLFVAESELGSSHEVCRDLLKLLEARTSIRCLIFRQPSHHKAREKFRARMLRVLHNHAHFRPSPGIWLFVALTWREKQIECELYTLNGTLDALIPVPAA